MFVCRTRTRSRAGKHYFTFRLARSQRIGDKVRQRTLLNLGSKFQLPRQHWRTLCLRVRQILDPRDVLLPLDCPDEVEEEAQQIAALLLQNGSTLSDAPGAAPADCPGGPDVERVDVSSLELARARSVGVEHVALWAAEQLGLPTVQRQLKLSGNDN